MPMEHPAAYDMLPGKGFFKLGQELHQVEPGEDEIAFAIRQIRRVHDHWSSAGTN